MKKDLGKLFATTLASAAVVAAAGASYELSLMDNCPLENQVQVSVSKEFAERHPSREALRVPGHSSFYLPYLVTDCGCAECGECPTSCACDCHHGPQATAGVNACPCACDCYCECAGEQRWDAAHCHSGQLSDGMCTQCDNLCQMGSCLCTSQACATDCCYCDCFGPCNSCHLCDCTNCACTCDCPCACNCDCTCPWSGGDCACACDCRVSICQCFCYCDCITACNCECTSCPRGGIQGFDSFHQGPGFCQCLCDCTAVCVCIATPDCVTTACDCF